MIDTFNMSESDLATSKITQYCFLLNSRIYNPSNIVARARLVWTLTWQNIPQLKLENIRGYSPIFKTARVAKKIWRIINTIASISGENKLGCLSLDIICSSKLTVFLALRSRKTARFSKQIMSADKYPSIFRAKWRLLFIYSPIFQTARAAKNIDCPRTLSVPQTSQFSLSYALGKLLTSRNRLCPRTVYLFVTIHAIRDNSLCGFQTPKTLSLIFDFTHLP